MPEWPGKKGSAEDRVIEKWKETSQMVCCWFDMLKWVVRIEAVCTNPAYVQW
jgi:hypothetical protein